MDHQHWRDWRRCTRERLLKERLTRSAAEREQIADRVCARLDQVADLSPAAIVSFYWPFKGELDLRRWISGLHDRGIRSALPVVIFKQSPMQFRLWVPGAKLERGIWNIPVPADAPFVTPDLVIAPLVGFDENCFRLGYGGGYFDRTLAELRPMPATIGVGYSSSQLPTIYPQSHDVPMDIIVTEDLVLDRPDRPLCGGAS